MTRLAPKPIMIPRPDVMAILTQYLPRTDYLQLYAGEHGLSVCEKLRLFEAAIAAKQDSPSPDALRTLDEFIAECLGIDTAA